MNPEITRYEGYECVRLGNQALSLWVTVSVGPRIIGLHVGDGANLLAVLPDAVTATPAGQIYALRGGHRLWHAPEDAERTYVPDDRPVAVKAVDGGVRLTQPVERMTGIEKRMTITLAASQAQVVVDHSLTNRGVWAVNLAPWAITQLRPGGFAILPQPKSETGLLPNRSLAVWPYTDVNSPHIQWGNNYTLVHANMVDGRLKIGWANPDGWLGYWIGGDLFIKTAAFEPEATYYDFGSSSECYCDPRFLELETLGPQVTLLPGASVTHREVWHLLPNVSLTPDEDQVARRMNELGLGSNESEP